MQLNRTGHSLRPRDSCVARGLDCGTKSPFALAAIAKAEIFRVCSKVLAAMRRASPERSLKAVLRREIQTTLLLRSASTIETRMEWMASAPNCRAMWQSADVAICKERKPTMQATTVGLDLGKDIFQVHGIFTDSTVVFNRSLGCRQLLTFHKELPSCLVGTEACRSVHHWARELRSIGHDARHACGRC